MNRYERANDYCGDQDCSYCGGYPKQQATFNGTVDFGKVIRRLEAQKSWNNMRDAMIAAWGKAATQEGSKPMEPGEYSYPMGHMSDIKITFNSTPYKKQVKDYLDPNGCHQCYVLRSKYVKLAGLKVDQTLGAEDVALVRCPKHEREYIAEIKKQLTEAISKIG